MSQNDIIQVMAKKHNSKTVRLSPDTMDKLGQKRIGFETADQCINRLLSKPPEITITDVPEEKEKKEPKITVTRID